MPLFNNFNNKELYEIAKQQPKTEQMYDISIYKCDENVAFREAMYKQICSKKNT